MEVWELNFISSKTVFFEENNFSNADLRGPANNNHGNRRPLLQEASQPVHYEAGRTGRVSGRSVHNLSGNLCAWQSYSLANMAKPISHGMH